MIIESKDQLKKETRKRVKRMKTEFSKPLELKAFENTEKYDQLIAQVGIPVSAKCEHHQVSIHGEVSVCYIPDAYVLGISKLARVAEWYMNPTIETLQERATKQIINYLQEKLKPKGLMVIIKAKHDCVGYRGVKKPSLTITSAIEGIFRSDSSAKQEFLSLVNANGFKNY